MKIKGSVITEMLVFLIVIALTSAVILFLVQSGTIAVRAENSGVSILNTEFIPFTREGILVIKEFQFCSSVNDNYNCVGEKNNFKLGEEVHFRFVVESSTVDGDIKIIENYRLIDPLGKVILDVDERNDYPFSTRSEHFTEKITFKDYFIAGSELVEGQYILELHLENPLIQKKTKISKEVGIYSYDKI